MFAFGVDRAWNTSELRDIPPTPIATRIRSAPGQLLARCCIHRRIKNKPRLWTPQARAHDDGVLALSGVVNEDRTPRQRNAAISRSRRPVIQRDRAVHIAI